MKWNMKFDYVNAFICVESKYKSDLNNLLIESVRIGFWVTTLCKTITAPFETNEQIETTLFGLHRILSPWSRGPLWSRNPHETIQNYH